MAGMLAGVECARRRRFHHGGGLSDAACPTRPAAPDGRLFVCTRRTPKSTIASSLHCTKKSESQKMKHEQEETLVGEAREAKQRLEERLSGRRQKVLGSKKGGFSWAGLGWKRTS